MQMLATALTQGLHHYSLATFRKDAVAGLVVSLIALPLAMALSIAVGLPPQHGIYTAIVAGIAAALLGGSPVQVSGPTAAFVVIVAPIVAQHGLAGIIWCQLMAGVLLFIMGSAKLGRYINYVPYPVTTGFTAGIGVVLATLSLNDFLGLGITQLKGEYVEKVMMLAAHLPSFKPFEAMVGIASLLVIVFFGKLTRAIPSAIAGIAAGALLAYVLAQYGVDIDTIGNRFTYQTAEGLKHGIPSSLPSFHLPPMLSYAEFKSLFVPALVIAALAALESLLSATVADGMAGTRHNPNAELNGIGIANIFSGLASGIPATGAIARTAANIHSGAQTPIASIIHALLIMFYVMLLSTLIGAIPMASLAALLLVVAYRMSHVRQFIRTIKIAPAADVTVLLVCFLLTVFIDMVAGVSVGIVLAALLFMKRISALTSVSLVVEGDVPAAALQPLPALPPHVMLYRIHGPLFFGTVEKCYDLYQFVHDEVRTLIIDMEQVPFIDMSGLVAMKNMLAAIAHENRQVILCGKSEVMEPILQKISDYPVRRHIRVADSVYAALQSFA